MSGEQRERRSEGESGRSRHRSRTRRADGEFREHGERRQRGEVVQERSRAHYGWDDATHHHQ